MAVTRTNIAAEIKLNMKRVERVIQNAQCPTLILLLQQSNLTSKCVQYLAGLKCEY